jgi:hypothetical protein
MTNDENTNAITETEPGYDVQPFCMSLSHNMGFKAWEALGVQMVDLFHALPFMIGDWLNYGDNEFKELAAQAYPTSWEYSESSLRNFQWVCSKVSRSLRLELGNDYQPHKLYFGHFQAVAALEPAAGTLPALCR